MRFMAQKTRTAPQAEKSAWKINNQIKKKQWVKAVDYKEHNLTRVGKKEEGEKGKNGTLGTGGNYQNKTGVDVREEG